MADELIDLLDENGKIIGTIMKHEAHKTGAWHKAVHVYLVNKRKELLLQYRNKDKDLYSNTWDISVGGHVGAGEDIIDSAIREVEEEVGLKLKKVDLEHLFTYKEGFKFDIYYSREFVNVFLANIDFNLEDITMQDGEVSKVKLVKVKEFAKMVKEKDPSIIPHDEEYEKVMPILLNLCLRLHFVPLRMTCFTRHFAKSIIF
ncbi:MAG: NUDIX domain-containing protein [Firmicutes bacterium]|nr:NUDIX domain-containing protein [Bacillota bacterium]